MSDKRNVAKQTAPIPLPNAETSPEQKDSKSLDDLWKEAVNNIQKEYRVNISAIAESESDGLQQPDQRLQKASELFEKSRHPEDRKTKVINAVSGCLDWTYSGVSFFKDHVSGTVSDDLASHLCYHCMVSYLLFLHSMQYPLKLWRARLCI